MKKESILNKNNQSQKEANSTDKNTHNNSKDEFKKKNNNEKNEIFNDLDFDINGFCPDLDAIDKKTRSQTVKQSVKKGKMKKLMEEEKSNIKDPRKCLKTPQLRPQKRGLNPKPLQLNPFSKKISKLNLINEENIILSEREEESEKSEPSSSSSSYISSDENGNEEKEEKDNINEENEE